MVEFSIVVFCLCCFLLTSRAKAGTFHWREAPLLGVFRMGAFQNP